MASPATFRHELDNPPGPKKVFDLGTAVHKLVLGDGPKLTVVPGARWDTKDDNDVADRWTDHPFRPCSMW